MFLAGVLRDQESSVGGCHQFRHVGVTSQELAMSAVPRVCFPDILLAVPALCSLWTLCQDPHRAQVSLWLCWSTSGTCKLIFSKGWHFSRCFWTGSLLGLRQSFHIYQGGGDLCAGPGSLSLCGIVPCAPSTLDDERLVLELRLEHPGV